MLTSAVPNWRPGDTILLGRVRDDEAGPAASVSCEGDGLATRSVGLGGPSR
jgi:hypothetical protein